MLRFNQRLRISQAERIIRDRRNAARNNFSSLLSQSKNLQQEQRTLINRKRKKAKEREELARRASSLFDAINEDLSVLEQVLQIINPLAKSEFAEIKSEAKQIQKTANGASSRLRSARRAVSTIFDE